jgi:hypothetical protein
VIGSVWGDFELSLHLVKGNKILCSRWCRTQGEPRDAHRLSYPITLNLFSTVRRIDDTAVKTFDEICSYQIIRLIYRSKGHLYIRSKIICKPALD